MSAFRQVLTAALVSAALGAAPAGAEPSGADPSATPSPEPSPEKLTTPPADDPARDKARELAEQGDLAFATGRCRLALSHWSEAERLFAAPTLTLRRARCHALLGEVVVASQLLRGLSALSHREEPEAFLAARVQAKRELAGVESRRGHLGLQVNSQGEPVRTTIDSGLASGAEHWLDPGRHLVKVSSGGAQFEQWLDVEEGAQHRMALRLRRDDAQVVVDPWSIVAYSLIGTGAASLTAGAVLGGFAVARSDDLHEMCGEGHNLCSRKHLPDIAELERLSVAADVTLIAGSVLATTGIVMAVVSASATTEQPTARLELVAGPGHLEGRVRW